MQSTGPSTFVSNATFQTFLFPFCCTHSPRFCRKIIWRVPRCLQSSLLPFGICYDVFVTSYFTDLSQQYLLTPNYGLSKWTVIKGKRIPENDYKNKNAKIFRKFIYLFVRYLVYPAVYMKFVMTKHWQNNTHFWFLLRSEKPYKLIRYINSLIFTNQSWYDYGPILKTKTLQKYSCSRHQTNQTYLFEISINIFKNHHFKIHK